MAEQLRYDNKVVIITGAGAGLGRQHALMFGARGAKVVVNDLGGDIAGGGKSSAAADAVVEEIKALGGDAVANYDSVEDGAKIVQTALDAFGTIDVLVNNAGILRDTSFAKMTDADWDMIVRIHLNGTKAVTHAAWPILRDKAYGRIVMTTSAAGIYGNFGQANYSAAKLGIYGLANTLAEEGRAKNILVNTIAPIAASRLTETAFPEEFLANLKPEAVSPLVGWLAHESCTETKGLFEVGAGYISKLRWERTRGYSFGADRAFTPDDVARQWNKITDFADAEHPVTVNDTFTAVMQAVNTKTFGGNEFIDLDVAMREELVLESAYDERDLAIYALGVGAARDPMDDDERKFVYELGDFHALPTWGVMPQSNAMLAKAKDGGLKLPGMSYGFDRILHGEQYTEVRGPLPKSAKLKHIFKFKQAYDKDPHAVVVFGVSTVDEHGEELVYNEMTSFVKGAGGWGGERGPSADINVPPARKPDAIVEEATDANQTLLYRLSGDWNPLHADPAFAKAFGYDKPILHGLCTFGHVGRHVVKAMLGNDPRKFKSIKVRFAEPVFPGETLVTKMWKEADNRVIVETSVKERGKVVIKNAVVEFYDEIPVRKPKAASQDTDAAAAAQPDKVIPQDVFAVIADHVAGHPELAAKVDTAFQFKLNNPESHWVLDLKTGADAVREGIADKADCTIELDADLLHTVVTAPLADVQKLFFGGQMKVGGDVMASNKLSELSVIDPDRYDKAKARRLAGNVT
ncbi:Short-chain dehydrogenase/reductase SDR [Sphingopyxis sp. LC81]|uniref:peroxisomal multifunctional enzyme type 2 n=1 Tax=Sphingopyxis sp. LC81 TaxID=1502850 RepID=UPI00050E3252|nr:peroxisomal multifunctional enzyme type 2 [Sphingopyxis sp. LC81]KGB56304.1 Short-chain dehydrogenase/reductase SDR [Sphingopyxis sp. LC81]